MKTRVSLTLSPESAAHIRESAPDNASRYVDGLVRRARRRAQDAYRLLRHVGWTDAALGVAVSILGDGREDRPLSNLRYLHESLHVQMGLTEARWEELVTVAGCAPAIEHALRLIACEVAAGDRRLAAILDAG